MSLVFIQIFFWNISYFKINSARYNKICILVFIQIFSETFLILRLIQRDVIKYVYWSSCKVSVILLVFSWNWIFSADFRKMVKYKISWNSVQWNPSCSMRTNGRTDKPTDSQKDMTKLIIAFRSFTNAHKNVGVYDVN